ncbi:CFI-box-CTERM domain-containing protein [Vibrio sp. HN007]|uniref:CFI-box-CTERM domain-containing protein n=1 Tax=Vibrio iocasae TaxID=3098914 RepID=UPI0035D49A6F
MTINNNRRRLVAAVSAGAMLLPFSRTALASSEDELPACRAGEFIKNGWYAEWNTLYIEVSDTKDAKFKKHTKDPLKIRPKSQYQTISDTFPIFDLKAEFTVKFELVVEAVPHYIQFNDTYYEVNSVDDVHVYKKLVGPNEYADADIQIELSRGSTKHKMKLTQGDWGTDAFLILSESAANKFLGYGSDPVYVTLLIDGKSVVSRRYDCNGIMSAYSMAKDAYDKENAKADAGKCEPEGCFLTTATCGNLGLSDDCWELETLRNFRDNYMMKTEAGQKQIQEYYQVAPAIVSALNQAKNTNALYLKMYWRYILPSALLIKLGMKKQAHQKYMELLKWVKHHSNQTINGSNQGAIS